MAAIIKQEHIRKFVLGGNAIITLRSGKTGNHFTYHIVRNKNNNDLYSIRLLRGPDNTRDYTYIGSYYSCDDYFYIAKPFVRSSRSLLTSSVRAMDYFLSHIDNIPPLLYVYHEGRCARCGRRLTTPESIERGFGPECYKMEN